MFDTVSELFNNFVFQAIVAGSLIALLTGVMGCFIIWRRLSYFGDALAHSSFLGIALGYLIGINLELSILLVSLVFASFVVFLQHKQWLSNDASLGVLSHAGFSFGLLLLIIMSANMSDLESYLFGSLLSISSLDLILLFAALLCLIGFTYKNFSALVLLSIDESLAASEGINGFRVNLFFMLLLAAIVAVSAQIVGVLLIASLLIVPAATARFLVKDVKSMVFVSCFISLLSVAVGISAAFIWDLPTTPLIVVSAVVLFILSLFKKIF